MDLQQAYETVLKPNLQSLCCQFRSIAQVDLSLAEFYVQESFLKAFETFDPRKGELGKRVTALTLHKARALKGIKTKIIPGDMAVVRQKEGFNLNIFLDSLSQDARVVVKIALDLFDVPKARYKMQRRIIAELLWKGWSRPQIDAAFEEIASAL